jgi:dihydrofolate reductase
VKISVVNSITLDGVMQSPAAPDEDTRGGFKHGGWAVPYPDEVMFREMSKGMARDGSMLFGRVTYLDLHAAWAGRDDNPYSQVLNKRQKYVASNTLREPLPWANSTLLSGDAGDAVAKLKRAGGPDIGILGSGQLVQALMKRGLVDEFILLIHPIVLGSGKRLFDDGVKANLKLVDSVTTTTGVVIATYATAT